MPVDIAGDRKRAPHAGDRRDGKTDQRDASGFEFAPAQTAGPESADVGGKSGPVQRLSYFGELALTAALVQFPGHQQNGLWWGHGAKSSAAEAKWGIACSLSSRLNLGLVAPAAECNQNQARNNRRRFMA
jgi:hypothetical protein